MLENKDVLSSSDSQIRSLLEAHYWVARHAECQVADWLEAALRAEHKGYSSRVVQECLDVAELRELEYVYARRQYRQLRRFAILNRISTW